MVRLARSITIFSKPEASALFKSARTKLKEQGLEIRLAPKLKEFGRILIVIPRRSGNAAKRNRVRRRLKSIFYEEHLFEQGQDCIVLVSRQAVELSFDTLKDLLLQAFKNAQ